MMIRVAGLTDIGGRSCNEDLTGYWTSPRAVCCVVADGAGGHGGGDVAAGIVVRTVLAHVARALAGGVDEEVCLSAALLAAHEAIVAAQAGAPALAAMCSTGTVLLLDRETDRAWWAHCGDTRLYWLRGGVSHARTRDHTLVASMVASGLLTEAAALTHPKRHMLLSALGAAQPPEVEASPRAETVRGGDVFLVCTDGMWEYLDDAYLARSAARAHATAATRHGATCPGPAPWLDALGDEVRRRAPASADNCSAIAVWMD